MRNIAAIRISAMLVSVLYLIHGFPTFSIFPIPSVPILASF